MEDSIIYQSIIELSKDKSYEDIIFDYDEFINLTKSGKGFFGSPTLWNQLSENYKDLRDTLCYNKQDITLSSEINLEEEILFIFKSGVIFTKTGIITLYNRNKNSFSNIFPFIKSRFGVGTLGQKCHYFYENKLLNSNEKKFHTSLCGKANINAVNCDENGTLLNRFNKLLYGICLLKVVEPNLLLIAKNAIIDSPEIDLDEIKLENEEFTNLLSGGFFPKPIKLYESTILNEKEVQFFKELDKLVNKKREELIQSKQKKEEKRVAKLNKSINEIIKELDLDDNGKVDVIEGNDFNLLLKKHQKNILEINRDYIQQFVKVSSYIKTKKENIQSIFDSIKDIPDEELLNVYVEILKGNIHSYNLLLYHSLNMVSSLVEEDMISFYEIYEAFDNLNMFDSKWERDISKKLSEIKDGLKNLMFEIREMGEKISAGLSELTYATEQSNNILDSRLEEIGSSIKTNNLLTLISTYQTYKINKNTKSLR